MPDQELLEQVARALRPGAVKPPARRVNELRRMVAASATTVGNGAGTTPDGQLIDDVEHALRPGAVEPPAERVEALRRLVTAPAAATDGQVAITGEDTNERLVGTETKLPGGVVDLQKARAAQTERVAGARATRSEWEREGQAARFGVGRLSRMLSGLTAAAAVAVLVAVVAVNQLPSALRGVAHNVGLPVDSPEQAAAERDVGRLQLALARQDAAQVAEADAAMLRSTSKLSGDELKELRDRAVRLHVEALAFLRDNSTPEAISDLASPEGPAPGTALTPDGQAAPGTQNQTGPATAAPPVAPPSGSTNQPPPVPTTVPPEAPTVRILSVLPQLDASFQVNFEVSGFTLGPGQPYSVHFFFDNGQVVTSYSGPSPWIFPLLNAVKYHTVCAEVADASGARLANSGGCKPILLM